MKNKKLLTNIIAIGICFVFNHADAAVYNDMDSNIISNGETTEDNLFNDQSMQETYLGAVARNNTFNDNSFQSIYSGGIAENSVFKDNSYQTVYSDGIVHNTVLNDNAYQILNIRAIAEDTDLNDNSLQYVITSDTYRTTVNDNAAMIVVGKANVYDTVINNGTMYLYQGANVMNQNNPNAIEINNGTLSLLSDSVAVNGNIAMNNGNINFMRNGDLYRHASGWDIIAEDDYKTMTINGDLTGNGNLFMSTDIVTGDTDRLKINGNALGNYKVSFISDATAAANGTETVPNIVMPDSGDGSFKGKLEYGGYLYAMKKDDNGNWGLVPFVREDEPTVLSSTTAATINSLKANYMIRWAEMETLRQRLGELHENSTNNNFYMRTFGGKLSTSQDNSLDGFGLDYAGIQFGFDRKQGSTYTGLLAGYTKGKQDYGVGSGTINSYTVGAYTTTKNTSGVYTDLVAKYNKIKNNYNTLDVSNDQVKDDITTNGYTLSLEVGKKYDRANGWYVEPQSQLVYGKYGSLNTVASNGLNVQVDGYNSLIGRLGVVFGREIKNANKKTDFYGKLSYLREFNADLDFKLNGSRESKELRTNWLSYGIGINTQYSKSNSFYMDIARASGNTFDQSWQVNLGVRGDF